MRFEVHGIRAIVPVKRFVAAKQRLRSVLSQYEREQLAEIMLCDVLAALRPLRRVEGVIVVTADPAAVEIAHSFGACVVADRLEAGVNMAAMQGLQALQGNGGPVAVVAADIPFATSEGIEQVLTGLENDPVVLAPAITDGGTNLLAMRCDRLIEPSFGEKSFARHCELARAAKLSCGVYEIAGLGHDIDRPGDLIIPAGSNRTRTAVLLERFNIAMRLCHREHRLLACN